MLQAQNELLIIEDDTLAQPNPGGQSLFLNDYSHRFCAYIGGWGSGKSWAGARKLANLHVHNAFNLVTGKPTFTRGLMVSVTYALARVVNMPQLEAAFDEMGLRWKFIADPKRYCYEFEDLGTSRIPSELFVRSAERPDLIAGFEVGHIWGDEAARWYNNVENPMADALLQSEGRLRDSNANISQFNMTFTHEGEFTQVFSRFEAEPRRPDHAAYRSSTRENSHLPQSYVDSLQDNLTTELAKQYIDGHAASFKGGLCYDNYNEALNLDPSIKLNYSRPLQLAIDFNINPGCHAIIGQHYRDPNELAVAIDELYEDRMDVKRLVNIVMPKWLKENGAIDSNGAWRFPGRLELFGDATGGNAQAATGESCWEVMQASLKAIGIPFSMANIPTANPHVSDRVQAMNCAFLNARSEVRYKVSPKCSRLIRDFKILKWKGNEMDKDNRKLSHPSDADGYRIFQLIPIRKIVLQNSAPGSVGSGYRQ